MRDEKNCRKDKIRKNYKNKWKIKKNKINDYKKTIKKILIVE